MFIFATANGKATVINSLHVRNIEYSLFDSGTELRIYAHMIDGAGFELETITNPTPFTQGTIRTLLSVWQDKFNSK